MSVFNFQIAWVCFVFFTFFSLHKFWSVSQKCLKFWISVISPIGYESKLFNKFYGQINNVPICCVLRATTCFRVTMFHSICAAPASAISACKWRFKLDARITKYVFIPAISYPNRTRKGRCSEASRPFGGLPIYSIYTLRAAWEGN